MFGRKSKSKRDTASAPKTRPPPPIPLLLPPPPPPSDSPTTPPSPTLTRTRPQPQPIRLHPIGVDPASIVGKVLTRIRSSPTHPAVTLDFADRTTYQVRVDGYDPAHRGVPKSLETNALLARLCAPAPAPAPAGADSGAHVRLTVARCTFVKLKDTAHARAPASGAESRWRVEHLALALQFAERPGWHCVWATMAEYEGEFGPCKFRSFDDVYLAQIQRAPAQKSAQHPPPPPPSSSSSSSSSSSLPLPPSLPPPPSSRKRPHRRAKKGTGTGAGTGAGAPAPAPAPALSRGKG